MVFLDVEMSRNVLIQPDQLYGEKGLLLQKAIIIRLMDDVATKKASKEHGYYVAVTCLDLIGDGKVRELTGEVLFPVRFHCITMKPCKGEVLIGRVDKIMKHGILLKCGAVETTFLSHMKMKDYKYMSGENPMFMNEDLSKLERDTKVRFKVLGMKWLEHDREFQMLATLEGDYLGPIV